MGVLSKIFTWWNGATVGTALFTRRFGGEVGRDEAGNIYYQGKKESRAALGDLRRRQRWQPGATQLAGMVARNDRRPSRQGAAGSAQVSAEADAEPDGHDGSVPS